nr:MAG TPA: hypothetical protein [Caudoviricetes sp.]
MSLFKQRMRCGTETNTRRIRIALLHERRVI